MLLNPFDLGPFELHRCVGAGGMGQVWRGVHRASRVPVAVKVIRSPEVAGRRFTLAFRNEVRQVAKLDHPHVVRILDYGEVDAAAEAGSSDQLREGSPYFVMEYASAGSLADHLGAPLDWAGVRSTLLDLLSGLAHAHARGVLHRDISPRNVLLAGPGDPRPGVKLADFGLARGELASDMLVDGGTPQYMPPEQFELRVREQGPWTDLYSLACLGWELVTGAPLFAGRTARDLHRLHVGAPIPPLVPRFDVPDGLEAWFVRSLQKEPGARFRFAADAARALDALGPAAAVELSSGGSTIEVSGPFDGSEGPGEAVEAAPLLPPVVPIRWRTGSERRHPLLGIGLGLYELRTLPLVDRRAPGDQLWDALRTAWELRRPQLTVLAGPTGHGKTHLARSVAWRAQELVGAELVTVEHGPVVGPTHGVRHALATALGCAGCTVSEVQEQVRHHLGAEDPDEAAALVRYLLGVEPILTDEQDALGVRVLARLAARRPLVVRLEGLQWGPETVRFALAVLAAPGPLPALLIGTVDPPGEVDPRLVGRPDVATVEIGPLAEADQLTLVRELLSLEDGLAERVVHRTRGSPLFAERLVGDWVRRDRLALTAGGYGLVDGTADELPDDLHQVWLRAIEGALGHLGPGAAEALYVACALGIETDRQDWVDGCARLGIGEAVVDELADALGAARLAEPGPGSGWRFTHPLVWESVRRQAMDRGRWAEVNRACAAMLADRPDALRQQERLGLHLLAAGRLEESLGPLLAGARRCLDAGEYPAAQSALDRRDEAMRTLRVPDDDQRWGEGQLAELRVLVGRGAMALAQAQGAALAERCRAHGWKALLPEALRSLGLSLLKLGKLLDAEAMFALAQATASLRSTHEARVTVARCAMYRGTILRIRGSFADALEVLTASLEQFEALGDRTGVADCEAEIAHARLVLANELDLAEEAIGRAEAAYAALGNQVGVATCVNTVGDIHRRRGDLVGAERAYRWALHRFDRLGSDARLFPRLNLGMVLLGLGQVAEADGWFAEAQELVERSGRAGLLGVVRLCRLPGAALRGDWAAWDAHLDATSAGGHHEDPDLAAVLDQAASLAESAGQPERAAAARARGHSRTDGVGQIK